MKKTLYIFLTVFFVCNLPLICQNNIIYEYDFAGNRTSRYVFNLKSNNKQENEDDDVLRHKFGEREVHVYPNPTKGELTVEIWNGDLEENYRLVLFDVQGKQLIETKLQGNNRVPLDLSLFPSGTYILILYSSDAKTEYKIIKE